MQKHLLYIVLGCAGLIFLCVIGGLLFFGEPMLAALVFAVGLIVIGGLGIYNWYRRQNLEAGADASVETQPEASDSITKTPPSQGQAKPAETVPSPATIAPKAVKPAPKVMPPPLPVTQVTPPPLPTTHQAQEVPSTGTVEFGPQPKPADDGFIGPMPAPQVVPPPLPAQQPGSATPSSGDVEFGPQPKPADNGFIGPMPAPQVVPPPLPAQQPGSATPGFKDVEFGPQPKPADDEFIGPMPASISRPTPASKPALKTYAPGEVIAGRYEVASAPMMGGMGIVYICLDRQKDLPVALKTFKPEYLPDREARDRFLREGTTWVNLGSHLHIARCYEVVRDETGLEVYLALEPIAKEPGREDASLRSWLFPGYPLPQETALLFALQIARGMQHAAAHVPGFVHRDLKPENILVGADHLPGTLVNRVRVTDFGLVNIVAEDQAVMRPDRPGKFNMRQAQFTQGAGTPLYMAPEQWQGTPVGVYTDVYALGCILYEMLTGYWPADGDSPDDLAYAHCTGNLRPLPNSMPGAIRDFLRRCLSLNPGARYADWDNVESALTTAYTAVTGKAAPRPADAVMLSREERIQVGWSYHAIGIAYMDISKATIALGCFEGSLAVGRAEGKLDLIDAGITGLGHAYHALGNMHEAVKCHTESLLFARNIGNQRSECGALSSLGSVYNDLGNSQQAVIFSEQALNIAHEIRDRRREASALCTLGNAHSNLGDKSQAVTFYEQYLEISQELSDWHGEAAALSNLGLICVERGDIHRAIAYYERALEIDRQFGDRRGEGADLENLGNAYYALNNAHQAIMYHDQALIIAQKIADRRFEDIVLGNLGNAYSALGDTSRAIVYYERALAIDREIGDVRNESLDLWNLATELYKLGNSTDAIVYARAALEIFERLGAPQADTVRQKLTAWRQAE